MAVCFAVLFLTLSDLLDILLATYLGNDLALAWGCPVLKLAQRQAPQWERNYNIEASWLDSKDKVQSDSEAKGLDGDLLCLQMLLMCRQLVADKSYYACKNAAKCSQMQLQLITRGESLT
jgi:hypothetical protein